MDIIAFFLTIFFGIFGAYCFVGIMYNAAVTKLAKRKNDKWSKKKKST